MKGCLIAALCVVGGTILMFFMFAAITGGNPDSLGEHTVTYQLSGYGAQRADITIQNESGGTEQQSVTLPWKKTFTASFGQFLYLSAQNQGYGDLMANLYVDGRLVQTATATTEYGIASVSGTAK